MMNIIKNNLSTLTKKPLARLFGKKSRGQTTPRVIKDNRFTRKGYQKMKKSRPQQYDLEGVENADLYYDHKIDGPKKYKEWKTKRNLRRKEIPIEEEDYDLIIEDLLNHSLLTRGSYKLVLRIRQLETIHASRIGEWEKVVNYVINQALGGHFVQFKLRTFAPLMVFAAKYATLPPKRFKDVAFFTLGLLKNSEYQETPYEGIDQRKIVAVIRGLDSLYNKGMDAFPQTREVYNGVRASMFESLVSSGQLQMLGTQPFLGVLDITTSSENVRMLGDDVKEMVQNCLKGKIENAEQFARLLSIDSKFRILEDKDVKRLVNQSLGSIGGKKGLTSFVDYLQLLSILKSIQAYPEYANDKSVSGKLPKIFDNFNQLFLNQTSLSDLFVLYNALSQAPDTPESVFTALKEKIAKKFSQEALEVEDFANYVIYSDNEGAEINEVFVENFTNVLRDDQSIVDNQLMNRVEGILAESKLEEFDELRNEIQLKLNQY